MRRLWFVVGAIAWASLVFVATFWLTFPSKVVSDRIRYEIPNFLGRDYSGEVGAVSPWWIGLSADDIKLYKEAGRAYRGETDGGAASEGSQLVALLRNVSLRVRPWSLLRRAPYVSGSITLTDGRVDYSIGTAANARGDIQLADLVLEAEQMPLTDLFVLIPDLTATGVGAVDLELDLHAGEEGMRDATGRIAITGSHLTLSDIEVPMVGALGVEVPISELALTADVVDGIATFNGGKIQSDIATVEITGTVTLRDPIDRSAVDVQIALSNLGEALTPFVGFMSKAKQTDGTYQYSCRGVLSRLSANSCTVGSHERRVSSRPTAPGSPGSSAGSPIPRSPLSGRDPETDAERERRREEIRERLRQKREEREAGRSGSRIEDPVDPPDEDPELTDEEHEEELPVEDLEPDLEDPLE